jgi:ABC-2 type transport system ATP-binding protein
VEELCDHIALIHKSNKLIEGNWMTLKEFKTNSFEVGIISDNVEGLMYDITQKLSVLRISNHLATN